MLLAAECQGRPLPNINNAASQWQQIFDISCAPDIPPDYNKMRN